MKKKLLFVNHNSDLFGGANDDFIRLLKYFSLFKDKFIITGLFPDGPNALNYSKYCAESYTYSLGFFPITNKYLSHYYFFLRVYFIQKKEIQKVLNGKEFDLCIFNVVVMFWIMKWVKKRKTKSIIFIREMIVPDFVRKIYYKLIIRYGDYFVCVSNSLEKDFRSITGRSDVKTLYSSIEKESEYGDQFESVKSQILNSEFKNIILSKKPKFINIGSINDNKNQFMILESAKLLRERLNDEMPYFVFIGPDLESPYGDKLRGFIEKEKLSHNCYLMGQKDKDFIYSLFSQMSGMIISSKNEGLPLVLAEALRFRIPLISTKAGGIPDIIENGFNGLLIDNNPESLADAIMNIMVDKSLSDRIKENGYNSYVKNFNLEKNLREIKNIVEKLI